MASELMRRCLGLLRPALSLRRSQGGAWGAVVEEGRPHFKPAALPVSASRVIFEWLPAAARSKPAFSADEDAGEQKAVAKASASGVHERIVSVRPCLKAAVEADSYVAAEWPCIR